MIVNIICFVIDEGVIMMNLNGISIVIATKGRVKLLGDLLESVYTARSNFNGDSKLFWLMTVPKKT